MIKILICAPEKLLKFFWKSFRGSAHKKKYFADLGGHKGRPMGLEGGMAKLKRRPTWDYCHWHSHFGAQKDSPRPP